MIADNWRNLLQREKEKYVKLSETAKQKYAVNMADYIQAVENLTETQQKELEMLDEKKKSVNTRRNASSERKKLLEVNVV